MSTHQEVIVHSTRNYNLFHFLKENRPVSEKHLKHLERIIKEDDRLLYHPILARNIDGRLFITDGQHRYEAAKKLNKTLYYIIDEGSSANSLAGDQTQKSWKLVDYLHYYVIKGIPEYIEIDRIIREYQIPLASVFSIMGNNRYDASRGFKNGTATVPTNIISFLRDSLEIRVHLSGLDPAFKDTLNRRDFIRAFYAFYKKYSARDFEALCKMMKRRFGEIPNRADTRTYLAHLVNLKNYWRHKKNRIRSDD